ncbi:DUF1573 domain-containing protein [Persicobacter psychrovividus]|uniref:DUF1573 domain-containing protein n=1 Tax=Persicobacter psychrovividus TaxID=387638 RepID=A0ABM7VDB4_9BACT|nr:hypothetical protein PEPS_12200 [Persicobacter psychrovividus]
MKYCLLILGMLMSSVLLGQQLPDVKWSTDYQDFGQVVAGDSVALTFDFENAGPSPLVISKVITTCGCTVPTYPKEPVKAGQKAQILVHFNSRGKIGRQNKLIRVVCNVAEGYKVLRISGTVIEKD